MPDILNTSLTGLRAFQSALATTSHNIANVNTDGYSRQRVNFGTMPAQNVGVGYIGSGVQPQSVVRILDQYRVDSLRTNISEEARLGAFNDLAGGIDGLLASPDSGLSQPLQDFFAALQTVADNPSSVSARQVALSQANVLSDRVFDSEHAPGRSEQSGQRPALPGRHSGERAGGIGSRSQSGDSRCPGSSRRRASERSARPARSGAAAALRADRHQTWWIRVTVR